LQSAQPDTSGGVSSSTASYTINTTTTVDNDFLICYSAGNRTTSAGANATAVTTLDGLGDLYEHSSNPLTPAGAKSMTINQAAGSHNGYHWISIKPSAAVTTFTPRIMVY